MLYLTWQGSTLTNLRHGGDFPSQTTFMLDTTANDIFEIIVVRGFKH